jgi:hypothetical protein
VHILLRWNRVHCIILQLNLLAHLLVCSSKFLLLNSKKQRGKKMIKKLASKQTISEICQRNRKKFSSPIRTNRTNLDYAGCAVAYIVSRIHGRVRWCDDWHQVLLIARVFLNTAKLSHKAYIYVYTESMLKTHRWVPHLQGCNFRVFIDLVQHDW